MEEYHRINNLYICDFWTSKISNVQIYVEWVLVNFTKAQKIFYFNYVSQIANYLKFVLIWIHILLKNIFLKRKSLKRSRIPTLSKARESEFEQSRRTRNLSPSRRWKKYSSFIRSKVKAFIIRSVSDLLSSLLLTLLNRNKFKRVGHVCY